MSTFVITDAAIERVSHDGSYRVIHPTNDAILAYCDTEVEAIRFRDAINDAADWIRRIDFTKKPESHWLHCTCALCIAAVRK